ncbi:hypothetical protein ACE6H2_007332 [Prunus campanulata]
MSGMGENDAREIDLVMQRKVLISCFPMCVLVIRKRKKQGETSFSSFSSRVSATFPDARSGSLRIGQIYTKPLKDEVPVQLLLHDSLSRNSFSPFFLLQTSFYHNFHSTTPILAPLSPLGSYERALQDKLPYPLLQALYDFANPGKNVQEKEEADDLQHCLPCFQPCFPFSRSTPSDDHPIGFEKTEPAYDHPFLKLTCEFFWEYTKLQPIENGVQVKHFTDLVRYFMWPEKMPWVGNGDYIRTKTIYEVRKLKEAGVKFRPNEGSERFVIKRGEDHKCNFKMACFRNMNLKLTKFWARYEVECVIRNVMALEQLMYAETAYVCSYFLMLDQLVDTVKDVKVLIESEVIVNLLGSSNAVVKLINSLCEQVMVSRSCYEDICNQLKEHYEISFYNRNISTLKRVYFKDLWTGSSTILGVFVLVFSIIGTIKSLMS